MSDDSTPGWLKIFLDEPKSSPKTQPQEGERESPFATALSRIFLNPVPPRAIPPKPGCLEPNGDTFFWGMHDVPISAASRHQLIVGTIGSGKSLCIELLLQSIAHRFRKPKPGIAPERMIVLDVKGTYYPFLTYNGLDPSDITIVDPFDVRCSWWNIAEDITSDAAAEKLAALIIPAEEKANTPFFWQSARVIVSAVIVALNTLRPGRWTLRDLIHSFGSVDNIRRLVRQEPRVQDEVEVYLADQNHFPTIHTSIMARIRRLKIVAALWSTLPPERSFSITRWLKGHGVLLLGHQPKYIETLSPINSLLLRMISDELQSWPDVRAPHTWIILDEFRWMKEVECMAELLGVGRSKGAAILLGIQDVSGMRVEYGPDRADEILGLCENKSFLKVGNPPTAEWASKYFADREATETKISHTYGKDNSTTHAKDIVTRPVYLPGEFLDLSRPENIEGSRFEGIHDIPAVGGAFSTDEDAQVVMAMNRKPPQEHIQAHPNLQRAPTEAEILTPWSALERESILGKSSTSSPAAEPEPTNPLKAFLNNKLRNDP